MRGAPALSFLALVTSLARATVDGIGEWTDTGDAGWTPRWKHAAASLPNGSIVVTGGADNSGTGAPNSEVWFSGDQGLSWTQVASAAWPARSEHALVALSDGSVLLTGGFDGSTHYDDVWRSEDGGASWTGLGSAAWSGRRGHAAVQLPSGPVVLIGGSTGGNEAWHSTDRGATWTSLGTVGWSSRYSHAAVALQDGSIVAMGGSGTAGVRQNDVWLSTDGGSSWTKTVTSAAWTAREEHAAVALPDDSIILMGGFDGSATFRTNDVWRSTDRGDSWTQLTDAGWTKRRSHPAVALPDGAIVVMGGWDASHRNDVWRTVCQPGRYRNATTGSLCLLCPAGSYEPDAGSTACDLCLAGKFGTTAGESSEGDACDACPAGSVSAQNGSTACDVCPGATFQPLASQAACHNCPTGQGTLFVGADAESNCIDCHAGWALDPATGLCEPCPAGTYQGEDASGNATCIACGVGTYNPSPAASSPAACIPCPHGTYRDQPAATAHTDCAPCPTGTYGASTGLGSAGACTPCPAGSTTLGNGSISLIDCQQCAAGTYASTSGSGLTCVQCPAGTFSSQRGASSLANCSHCPLGTYGPEPAAVSEVSCLNCPRGEYANGTGSSGCTPCPAGHVTAATGAVSPGNCTACEAGTYLRGVDCITCAPGKVSAAVGATGESTCGECAAGWYATVDDAVQCRACERGKFSLSPGGLGEASCVNCPRGEYANATGSSGCTRCPAGHVTAATGAVSPDNCTACEAGTYAEGTACVACDPGKASGAVAATSPGTCVACAAGAYAGSAGSAACTPCGAGTYLGEAGGVSAAQCLPCPRATYGNATGLDQCTPCPAGSTTANGGATAPEACEACALGQYLSGDRCLDCSAGTYSNTTFAASPADCLPCAVGSYSSALAATRCTPCPVGTASAVEGATSADNCITCGVGTFAAQPGQSQCTQCPAGTSSSAVGANSSDVCTACAAGTYEQGGACIACSAGTASNVIGSVSDATCQLCPPGHFATAGSPLCAACPAGTFRETAGATSEAQCQACPGGTYSEATSASSAEQCVDCPAGKASPGAGAASASNCSTCPAGSYAGQGSPQCEACPQGRYGPQPGLASAQACTPCPEGTYGAAAGLTSASAACTPCPAGTVGRREGLVAIEDCAPCDPGLAALVPGLTQCTPCPSNHYATGSGTQCRKCPAWAVLSADRDACDTACAAGEAPSVDQASCRACPPGTFAATANTTQCAECPPGTFTDGSGLEQCEACPVGEINPLSGQSRCEACSAEGRTTLAEASTIEDSCVCDAGTYSLDLGAATSACALCPANAVCKGKGTLPEPEEGYWVDLRNRDAPPDVMVPCIPPSACRGGSMVQDVAGSAGSTAQCVLSVREGDAALRQRWCPPELHNATLAELAVEATAQHCTEAYDGERCSECAAGYYRLNGACYSCSQRAYFTVGLAAIALVVGALCALAVFWLKVSVAPITIVVDFFQILGRQAAVDIAWGTGTSTALSWTKAFDFNVELLAPECVADIGYRTTWMAVMVLPIALVALMAIFHVMISCCCPSKGADAESQGGSGSQSPRRSNSQGRSFDGVNGMTSGPGNAGAHVAGAAPAASNVCEGEAGNGGNSARDAAGSSSLSFLPRVLLLCQLLYMVLVQKTLEAVDCVTLPDGSSVLEVSPKMDCWEGEHLVLATGGVAAFLVYVAGIPLLFFACLKREERASDDRKAAWKKAVEPIAGRFKPEHRQWMLVILIRKFVLASSATLNTTRPGFQLAFAAAVLCASIALQFRMRPYGKMWETDSKRWWSKVPASANLMENYVLGGSFVVVFGGLLFLSGSQALRAGTLQPCVMELVDVVVTFAIVASTALILTILVASMLLSFRSAPKRHVLPAKGEKYAGEEGVERETKAEDRTTNPASPHGSVGRGQSEEAGRGADDTRQ